MTTSVTTNNATRDSMIRLSIDIRSRAQLVRKMDREFAGKFNGHDKHFLAAFPDGRVGLHLQSQVVELEQLCAGLTESAAMFRYAEGKWTMLRRRLKEAPVPAR